MDETAALEIICIRSAKSAQAHIAAYLEEEKKYVLLSLEQSLFPETKQARAHQGLTKSKPILSIAIECAYRYIADRSMEQIHARLSLNVKVMIANTLEQHIQERVQVAVERIFSERTRLLIEEGDISEVYRDKSVIISAKTIAYACAIDVACLMMNVAETYAAKKALHGTPEYEYVIVDGVRIVKPSAGGGGGSSGGGAGGGGGTAKKPTDEAIATPKFTNPEDLPALQKLVDGKVSNSNISREDELMKIMYKDQGFDGKPQVVSAKQLDAYIADGEPELFRGVDGGNGYAKQFQSGKLFAGKGMYGNGTYAAHGDGAIKTAKDYAGYKGEILRMSLKRGSKVIEHNDLRKLQRTAMDDILTRVAKTPAEVAKNKAMATLIGDQGRFALSKGYSAIKVPGAGDYGNDYYVVLNRTALRVQSDIIPNPGMRY